jgi:hypothetical protein
MLPKTGHAPHTFVTTHQYSKSWARNCPLLENAPPCQYHSILWSLSANSEQILFKDFYSPSSLTDLNWWCSQMQCKMFKRSHLKRSNCSLRALRGSSHLSSNSLWLFFLAVWKTSVKKLGSAKKKYYKQSKAFQDSYLFVSNISF